MPSTRKASAPPEAEDGRPGKGGGNAFPSCLRKSLTAFGSTFEFRIRGRRRMIE